MKITRHIMPKFVDARGTITKILDSGVIIKSILLISSCAGSVRANHYHKKDSHFAYLLSGKMKYFERPVKGGKIKSVTLKAGDMIFTPPGKIHAMKFLEDTAFLAFATESRNQKNYEADVVRVPFIA